MQVILLTDGRARATHLSRWMRRLGHDLRRVSGPPEVLGELKPKDFDCLVAAIARPARYDLEGLSALVEDKGRPALLCLPALHQGLIERLQPLAFPWVLVEPVHRAQLRSCLSFSPPHAERYASLRRALARVEAQLEARKVVERAKGYIMGSRGVSEGVAHRALQAQSQKENKKLEVVARQVLEAASTGE